MTEHKTFKKYVSSYEDEKEKRIESVIITTTSKREAQEVADGLWGDSAEVKPFKEKKR